MLLMLWIRAKEGNLVLEGTRIGHLREVFLTVADCLVYSEVSTYAMVSPAKTPPRITSRAAVVRYSHNDGSSAGFGSALA